MVSNRVSRSQRHHHRASTCATCLNYVNLFVALRLFLVLESGFEGVHILLVQVRGCVIILFAFCMIVLGEADGIYMKGDLQCVYVSFCFAA